ncbi:hypothetical protein [Jannaschia marina]|uniref:hypothetical protein n=1 Tax=Jannaschia marina TaxID=2741674 RepID=UPI0015CDB457|nr:hypothetical protein [Jannaschia marina]
MIRTLLAAGLLALTAAPAAANPVNAKVQVTDDFAIGSSGWTGAAIAGRLFIAWRPIVVEGRPMVCGAYAFDNIRLRPAIDNMLREGAVTAEDRDLLRNLKFFNRVRARSEDAMVGTMANCTALPAGVGAQRMRLSLGNGDFRL